MNEKDEESERDADYKEWNYWQEQMNEKDEEGCEGGCVCCGFEDLKDCLLYTSPSPRDKRQSRMPSSA